MDFEALDRRLRELFSSLYPTIDLNNEAEFTRLLLGAKAHVGDRATYLMNRHGRESRMVTAVQRRNILAHAKSRGYRPFGATAAWTMETFTLFAPADADVPIPENTIVRTLDQNATVKFRTLAPAVIPAGQLSVTTAVEHSEPAEDLFNSNARADQEFRLSRSPYIDESATISTADGSWTMVENFLASRSFDRHFVAIIDAQDRCTIRFGNGVLGAIPSGSIDVQYKIGGGSGGRLPKDSLRRVDGVFTDANGTPVRITCNNNGPTTGGDDRESNASIKLNSQGHSRVPANAVGRTDYEDVATSTPGVARALMLTMVEDSSIGFNEGFLFIVPDGGGAPSGELLEVVERKFADEVQVMRSYPPLRTPRGPRPKTVTFQLRVLGAVYREIDILARVYPRAGVPLATLRSNIVSALGGLFAARVDIRQLDPGTEDSGMVPNPRVDFGFYLRDADTGAQGEMPYSDIYNAVRDAAGVAKVAAGADGLLVNGLVQDVVLGLREFPALGNVQLVNALTGQAF